MVHNLALESQPTIKANSLHKVLLNMFCVVRHAGRFKNAAAEEPITTGHCRYGTRSGCVDVRSLGFLTST